MKNTFVLRNMDERTDRPSKDLCWSMEGMQAVMAGIWRFLASVSRGRPRHEVREEMCETREVFAGINNVLKVVNTRLKDLDVTQRQHL